MADDDLFAPPDLPWQRLAPQYRTLVRLSSAISMFVVSSIAAILVGVLSHQWWISAIIWAVFAVLYLIRWVVAGRAWRAWGYAEREEDLYLTHGVLFRQLTAVPYGRMQLVEVESGPLQ